MLWVGVAVLYLVIGLVWVIAYEVRSEYRSFAERNLLILLWPIWLVILGLDAVFVASEKHLDTFVTYAANRYRAWKKEE